VNFQARGQDEDNGSGNNQRQLGARGDGGAYGAEAEAAGHQQPDFSRGAQRPQPDGAEGVVNLIDHL